MSNPKGSFKLSVGEKDYTLFLGMSVLADLQEKHGVDVLEKLEPATDADENWVPDLGIVTDLFMGALERYHSDEADRWLVDDILAENANALPKAIASAFPDAKKPPVGNGKKSKKAA